jgi:hypothetical protein
MSTKEGLGGALVTLVMVLLLADGKELVEDVVEFVFVADGMVAVGADEVGAGAGDAAGVDEPAIVEEGTVKLPV